MWWFELLRQQFSVNWRYSGNNLSKSQVFFFTSFLIWRPQNFQILIFAKILNCNNTKSNNFHLTDQFSFDFLDFSEMFNRRQPLQGWIHSTIRLKINFDSNCEKKIRIFVCNFIDFDRTCQQIVENWKNNSYSAIE